jgi:hypothetical protein
MTAPTYLPTVIPTDEEIETAARAYPNPHDSTTAQIIHAAAFISGARWTIDRLAPHIERSIINGEEKVAELTPDTDLRAAYNALLESNGKITDSLLYLSRDYQRLEKENADLRKHLAQFRGDLAEELQPNLTKQEGGGE